MPETNYWLINVFIKCIIPEQQMWGRQRLNAQQRVVMQIDCLVAGNEGLPLLGVALGLYVSAVLFFNGPWLTLGIVWINFLCDFDSSGNFSLKENTDKPESFFFFLLHDFLRSSSMVLTSKLIICNLWLPLILFLEILQKLPLSRIMFGLEWVERKT